MDEVKARWFKDLFDNSVGKFSPSDFPFHVLSPQTLESHYLISNKYFNPLFVYEIRSKSNDNISLQDLIFEFSGSWRQLFQFTHNTFISYKRLKVGLDHPWLDLTASPDGYTEHKSVTLGSTRVDGLMQEFCIFGSPETYNRLANIQSHHAHNFKILKDLASKHGCITASGLGNHSQQGHGADYTDVEEQKYHTAKFGEANFHLEP